MRALRSILCAAALLAAGCAVEAVRPPNIVVVLVDTLRFDRLGAYGDARGLTPFIDSLAARSTVFSRAYAQSSWTNASVAALFTSRVQSQHGVISFAAPLAAEEETLAEALAAHGYAAGAFLANFLLRDNLGFGQGFDVFETYFRRASDASATMIKAKAEQLNRESLAWVDARPTGTPLFLYLHFMEPHAPYEPSEAALARVLAGRAAPDAASVNHAMAVWPLVDFGADPALVQATKDLYDAEVATLDTALRDLFGELARRGVLEDAVVVLLADHGEEFLEHGQIGHNNNLYEESIRIPLLVHLPGQETRFDVDEVVSILDLAPTLLDLASVPVPARMDGRSLAPLLRRGRDGALSLAALQAWWAGRGAEPVAVAELLREVGALRRSPHERAIVAGTDKLIAGFDEQREFYDLAVDPREQQPQGLDEARRARLEGRLAPLQAAAAGRTGGAAIDEDTKERMRALGYTH